MVLGLINFLFGGRKRTRLSKSAQVSSPSLSSVSSEETEWEDISNNFSDGTTNSTFIDSREEDDTLENYHTTSDSTHYAREGHKKSLSEAIHKINAEIKESEYKITEVVNDIEEIENKVTQLGHRVDSLEEHRKQTDEKLQEVDENMTKFLSLYEQINNQHNPLAIKDSIPQTNKIELDSQGNTISNELPSEDKIQILKEQNKTIDISQETSNVESIILELDTINIEEAAGDAVPLQHIKNNTNSLVIILSWLEFLIKRVGVDETRNTLKYYTEILKWITPESYFELDKYLKGMKNKETQDFKPINVRDHIVSLYFISKLNEKKLDDKLTSAVLHIIKQ